MKKIFDKSKELTSNAFDATVDAAKSVGNKTGELIDDASKAYQESVVKEKLDVATSATSHQFDVLTGQKMYDLVQERLSIQSEINDALAYKLQEALERIEYLEQNIKH